MPRCHLCSPAHQGQRIWHSTIFPRLFNELASQRQGNQRGAQAISGDACQPLCHHATFYCCVQATDSKRGFQRRFPLAYRIPSRALQTSRCGSRPSVTFPMYSNASFGEKGPPPAFQTWPSRGPRPREHLRLQPPPCSAACPGRAVPCCAPLRRATAARRGV
jgi:hypothetical protein